MGDYEPPVRPPSLTEMTAARREVELAGELTSTHPVALLHEAVRRLSAIETYCAIGTQTEVTKDVVAMATTGAWHPAGKP